jgi:hypothetical protein
MLVFIILAITSKIVIDLAFVLVCLSIPSKGAFIILTINVPWFPDLSHNYQLLINV